MPPKELMAPYSEANLLIQEIMTVSQAPASTKTTNFPIAAVGDVQKRRREAIVISDSDDDSTPSATKHLAAFPNIAKQVTIKPESKDLGSGLVRANSIQQELFSKRAKLNSGSVNPELLKLREEDERESKELKFVQRAAGLLRKKNERMAKMAEIEVRSSPSSVVRI
jgi:hypothetical protein